MINIIINIIIGIKIAKYFVSPFFIFIIKIVIKYINQIKLIIPIVLKEIIARITIIPKYPNNWLSPVTFTPFTMLVALLSKDFLNEKYIPITSIIPITNIASDTIPSIFLTFFLFIIIHYKWQHH